MGVIEAVFAEPITRGEVKEQLAEFEAPSSLAWKSDDVIDARTGKLVGAVFRCHGDEVGHNIHEVVGSEILLVK